MEGAGMGFLVFGRSPIHSGRRRSRSPMAVQAEEVSVGRRLERLLHFVTSPSACSRPTSGIGHEAMLGGIYQKSIATALHNINGR